MISGVEQTCLSPHGTDAAQKKSTRLKGGKNPPFCGAPLWSGAGPADTLGKVALLESTLPMPIGCGRPAGLWGPAPVCCLGLLPLLR